MPTYSSKGHCVFLKNINEKSLYILLKATAFPKRNHPNQITKNLNVLLQKRSPGFIPLVLLHKKKVAL